MPAYNQLNLNVKKTVETTMDRAKGWLFAKYPSAVNPNIDIQIDTRYLGESIPASRIEIFSTPLTKHGLNFQDKPICIIMRRGSTEIYLTRDTFYDNHEKKRTSYVFSIYTPSNSYRIIETPDGCIKDQGNHMLLWAAQKDKDFGQYISFISKDSQYVVSSNEPKWTLSEMMRKSRERG